MGFWGAGEFRELGSAALLILYSFHSVNLKVEQIKCRVQPKEVERYVQFSHYNMNNSADSSQISAYGQSSFQSGTGCSKLTTSLVNVSLKF